MPNAPKDIQLNVSRPTLEDRRRPDRVTVAAPELVLLLCDQARSASQAHPSIPTAAPPDDPRHGDPIRGISIAIAVAIPIWISIVLGILVF
jgi:hypothetical protein